MIFLSDSKLMDLQNFSHLTVDSWFILVLMNGEVLGIYVSAGGSKCLVIIADWLVCLVDVSGLEIDNDVFLAVEFWWLFFLSLFFFSIGFLMTGNLNDIPLMWCLKSNTGMKRIGKPG